MQFLKKHYEKVILSVVLLGLAVAAAALPLEVNRVGEFLQVTKDSVVRTTAKPFKPVDLTTNSEVVARFASPVRFRFSEPHNLFNPVQWLKKPDGGLIKVDVANKVGATALVVTNIEELKLSVSFEGMGGTTEKPQYQFTVIRETEANPKKNQLATPKIPNALFTLVELKGPPDAPTSFVLILKKEKQPILVAKDKPYQRTIGYQADLRYPPAGNQPFLRKRKGDQIVLKDDTERYKIVAIDQNKVVLSAESTQKRTTVAWNPAP